MTDHPMRRCAWVPIGDGLRLLVRKVPCLMGEAFGESGAIPCVSFRFRQPPRWKRYDLLRGRVLEPDFRFNDARFGGDQIPMCRILY